MDKKSQEMKENVSEYLSSNFDVDFEFIGIEAGLAQTKIIRESFCYVARFENDSGKVFNTVIDPSDGAVVSFGPQSDIEKNGTIYLGQGKIETGAVK